MNSKMNSRTGSGMKKTAKSIDKTADSTPDKTEIARTIRMPRYLWEAASKHSSAMTAKGRGRWSINLVVVDAIAEASKRWDEQKGE